MASPSVTHTFTNATVADADEVNTNFTDIINGITDGTKDLSISALTCAGAATLNGAVTLGNASGDDITVTGSLASTIPIKTTATYNIGAATLGLLSVYLGRNSQSVRIIGSASMSATYTFTMPTAAGTKGHALYDTDGSATMGWAPLQFDLNAVSSADYTVTDTDGYRTIAVTTGASDRTVTLPTASANTDRRLTIIKADSGAGDVIIDGEGSETINGSTTVTLSGQYASLDIVCDGSNWFYTARPQPQGVKDLTISSGAITVTSNVHRVDTESAASTDNLDNINGGFTGQMLTLQSVANTRDPTIRDVATGGGNIQLAGASDFTFTNTRDTITMIYNGSEWLEISRADNS
jgi:hypothetical protein